MNMKREWILLLVAVLIIAAVFVPRLFKDRDLPARLHGTWETSDARYSDRYFFISQNKIGFGTGRAQFDLYRITNVKEKTEKSKILYTVAFQNKNGAEFSRSFYYSDANGGMIQFKNQLNIEWTLTKN